MNVTYIIQNKVDLLGLPFIFSTYKSPNILVGGRLGLDRFELSLLDHKTYSSIFSDFDLDTPILNSNNLKQFVKFFEMDHIIGGPNIDFNELLVLYESLGFLDFVEYMRYARVSGYVVKPYFNCHPLFESLLLNLGLNKIVRVETEDDFYNTISNASMREIWSEYYLDHEVDNIPEHWSSI